MTRDAVEQAACLALAPVHVGLAATLAHPALDRADSAGVFYLAAGAWLAVAFCKLRGGWGWRGLYALPLGALLLLHLGNAGAFAGAGAVAREALLPAAAPRRLLGVPAPRAAPAFRPRLRPGRLGRALTLALARSVVFLLRVAVGTPAWAWAAAALLALYLDRKGR